MFIKKLQDENEELKGSITRLKLQYDELQDLKQKAKNMGNHTEEMDKGGVFS
jgi:hypothetical protein